MDKEHEPPGKTQTSTPRTLRHQQRYQMLVSLYDQALARRPDLAQELGDEITSLLAENPALAEVFDTLFDRRPHSAVTALSSSPTLTTVLNAQQRVLNAPPTVENAQPTVLNGRLSGTKAARVAPSPKPLPPVGGKGRERDLHWDSLEKALGPCRGQKERDQRNAACAEMKQAGLTPDEIDIIAERWPSTMGFVMTANGMLKYAGQVLAGPQLRQHKQYLNETATHKHQPKFNSPEEYNRD